MPELKRSQEESHDRLLELETLYRTAPVGLAFLDHGLRYIRLNEAFAEMNDLPVEAHIGRYAGDINPALAKVVLPMMEHVLALMQPLLNIEIAGNSTADVMHQDQRTWMVSLHPLVYAGAFGVSVVFQDITQQRRTQAALLQSNDQIRQFAYAAAHNLQEPLRNICLAAQSLDLRHRNDADPETYEELTGVIGSARHMLTLVKDLLGFSEAGSGIHGERGHWVDCNLACQTALDYLASPVKECAADITVTLLPAIVAQDLDLILLFQNLIGNALKYSSKERSTKIDTSAERRDEHWVFSIKDNGIGIAAEHYGRIFGVFKRLHGREVPGTGIGLAICKRIVDHHGGRLWLESEVGRGSTFCFSFPSVASVGFTDEPSVTPQDNDSGGQLRRRRSSPRSYTRC